MFSSSGAELEKYKGQDNIIIPVDNSGSVIINYAGNQSSTQRDKSTTFDAYSYSDFVNGAQILTKNKIIMTGAFANGMVKDFYQTPMGTMFGIEVIANTVNTVLKGNYLIPLNKYIYLLILLLAALSIAILAGNKNLIFSYAGVFLFLLIYFTVSVFVFVNYNLVLELPKVILIALLAFVSVIVYRVLTEEKQKKYIKDIFSKYVNPDVVDSLIDSPPELGGVDRELSIFFSDIRGFTTLSEGLTTQDLITHLNKYFTAMTDIVLSHNGTLDKYIGDAVMCFWGAPKPEPNHAELACRAAIAQMNKLRELNSGWDKKMQIKIGIGINTGLISVGNVGSEGRLSYTVIGDNVNLASRLEGLTKKYHAWIIVSESTLNAINKNDFNYRFLDFVKVKGKHKPVSIYELLDGDDRGC